MNISELFQIQKKLDERITEKHPIQKGEDRLAKKILALQVELGELANEWRGFKFWSDDQRPRGEDEYLECRPVDQGGNRWVRKNPLLEEYVDCLHFILSIGLEIRIDIHEPKKLISLTNDTLGQFNSLFGAVSNWNEASLLLYPDRFHNFFNNFLNLGEMLGFDWDQIEKAYLDKNKINHARQESGY